jgi:hypothetical protein
MCLRLGFLEAESEGDIQLNAISKGILIRGKNLLINERSRLGNEKEPGNDVVSRNVIWSIGSSDE